jgi:hypothetical protein
MDEEGDEKGGRATCESGFLHTKLDLLSHTNIHQASTSNMNIYTLQSQSYQSRYL